MELGLIDIVYTGSITNQTHLEASAEAISLAKGEGPHQFLVDCTNAVSRLSAANIYDIPKLWESVESNRHNRLAIVVPEDAPIQNDAQFFESVTTNRGWNVQLCESRELAIAWLKFNPKP
jgi:hypothetical protein